MKIPLLPRRSPLATDPVCEMDVAEKNPPGGSWKYQNTTYYFCAPGCNRAFQKDPESYLSGENKLDMRQ